MTRFDTLFTDGATETPWTRRMCGNRSKREREPSLTRCLAKSCCRWSTRTRNMACAKDEAARQLPVPLMNAFIRTTVSSSVRTSRGTSPVSREWLAPSVRYSGMPRSRQAATIAPVSAQGSAVP